MVVARAREGRKVAGRRVREVREAKGGTRAVVEAAAAGTEAGGAREVDAMTGVVTAIAKVEDKVSPPFSQTISRWKR